MSERKTREAQYQVIVKAASERGVERMGLRSSESWCEDPKHIVFRMARYKFAAKMLSGRSSVLEIGCGDAFGTRIVQAEVGKLTAIDFDPVFIDDVNDRMIDPWRFDAFVHDMLDGPVPGAFDAVYALDVLEHIDPAQERAFLTNCFANLDPNGAAIVGMPSLESQVYASQQSKEGHVNCKSAPDLKKLMSEYFHNVFMFSMNDEVVHTGYHRMAHYVIALCAGRKS
ncbi:class I SAM-dependent methyltransferase [Methylobacterium sp. 1973]|uniref:class I SAM-dependent methyltransferase n=1 Tax=Methylobacterium sp. 1973 TaxID=3156421 RepID=UPI00339443AD